MTFCYNVCFKGIEGSVLTLMHDPIVTHVFKCNQHSVADWYKSWRDDMLIIHFLWEDDALLFMDTFKNAHPQHMRLSGIAAPMYLGKRLHVD